MKMKLLNIVAVACAVATHAWAVPAECEAALEELAELLPDSTLPDAESFIQAIGITMQ